MSQDSREATTNHALHGWLKRRAGLHHEWFGRRLLVNIARLRRSGGRPPKTSPLYEWTRVRAEFEDLLDDADEALSPVQILREALFSSLDPESLDWLKEVTEECFRRRSGVPEQVEHARLALCQFDGHHRRVLRLLGQKNTTLAESDWAGLESSAKKLQSAISDLPRALVVS